MAQAAVDLFGAESSRFPSNWQRAHEELLKLATARAGLDFEEGRWLVLALEKAFGALRNLGFRETDVRRALGDAHVGAETELSQLIENLVQVLTQD